MFGLSGQSFVPLFICLEFNVVCLVNNLEFNYWKKNNTCVITSWQLPRSDDMIVAATIIFIQNAFSFVFLIPWGSYRVCITAATGLSLSIKSDRLWHCRVTLTSIHSPLTVLINEKAKRCLFYVYFSSPFRTYCWTIVFQRLC